jgi:hypothetical protein
MYLMECLDNHNRRHLRSAAPNFLSGLLDDIIVN